MGRLPLIGWDAKREGRFAISGKNGKILWTQNIIINRPINGLDKTIILSIK